MRFPEAEITTIDLLRHGEPVGGAYAPRLHRPSAE